MVPGDAGRVKAAQLCRKALANLEVRAAMLEFLISMFVLVLSRGFKQVLPAVSST